MREKIQLSFKKAHPDAKLPTQGKPGDAAFDLCCVEGFKLEPGQTMIVDTGLVLANMPSSIRGESIFLHIVGRSGLASKGIFPIGGIVDSLFRGNIKVILHNGNQNRSWPPGKNEVGINPTAYEFKSGDKIASMLIQKIHTDDSLNQVEMIETHEVRNTIRGAAGFGSTGA